MTPPKLLRCRCAVPAPVEASEDQYVSRFGRLFRGRVWAEGWTWTACEHCGDAITEPTRRTHEPTEHA